jgi:hypothetical protein
MHRVATAVEDFKEDRMPDEPRRQPGEGPDSVEGDSTDGVAKKDEAPAHDEPTPEKKEDVQADALIDDRFEATDN